MDGRGLTSESQGGLLPRRILSIDGGGIKGVYPAAFLATIERAAGIRIADHFDLIAGTSTGGIIALGLGLGLSAEEILGFYRENGPAIFSQPGSKGVARRAVDLFKGSTRSARSLLGPAYDSRVLESALVKAFGSRILGESGTRLVIPAFSAGTGSVYVFKTSHHPRLELDWKVPAAQVALATSAAPTYFPAHTMSDGAWLLDGGVWANNPVGMAAVEAVSVLGWNSADIQILSLGCTEPLYRCPPRAGKLNLMLSSVSLFMQGQSAASLGTAKLLCGHTEMRPKLYRYSLNVQDGLYNLDSVNALNELAGFGATAAREALPAVRTVFLGPKVEPFVPFNFVTP